MSSCTPTGIASFSDAWDMVVGKPPIVKSTRLAISLSDHHYPFADKRLESSTLKLLSDVQPDDVVLNGDVIDFYSISRFLKDASRGITLQREVSEVVDYLRAVRLAVPDARIHYNLGNHEDRLTKYLASDAKALASLDCLKFEELLKIRDLDIELHGGEGFKLNRRVLIRHGVYVSKHAGTSARMEFEAHLLSGVSGHTHRVGRYDKTTMGGHFTWVEQGCMCRMDPEYIAGRPNWQHGFAAIEYSSRNHKIHPVVITDPSAAICLPI